MDILCAMLCQLERYFSLSLGGRGCRLYDAFSRGGGENARCMMLSLEVGGCPLYDAFSALKKMPAVRFLLQRGSGCLLHDTFS